MIRVRHASSCGLARVGDRARELRQLELVGEDRRHRPARRLPGVQRREREVEDEQRHGREEAREEVRAGLRRPPAGRRSRPRCLDRLGGAGESSTWRRTRRHGIAGASRRRCDDEVEALLRGRAGMLTSTSSARVLAIARSASSRLPTTLTPSMRRRRTRGLSSRKPTTRASLPSRSSRARLRPARPAPTTRTRLRSPRARDRLRQQTQHEPRRADEQRCRGSRRRRRSRRRGTSRSAAARSGSRTRRSPIRSSRRRSGRRRVRSRSATPGGRRRARRRRRTATPSRIGSAER